MPEKFANEIGTVLVGAINATATSLGVASSSGFPAPNFRARIDAELILVTAGPPGSTTWTVTRGIEGSVAASHADGAAIAHVLTAGGLVQAIRDSVDILLDYTAATDINNGTPMPAATWTDIGTNQSFTVVSASSVVEIAVRGMILAGNNGVAASEIGSRIIIDSAGTPVTKPLGGAILAVASAYVNALAGGTPIKVAGLTAGVHTIKAQVMCASASSLYCRPSGGVESYAIQVTEMAG